MTAQLAQCPSLAEPELEAIATTVDSVYYVFSFSFFSGWLGVPPFLSPTALLGRSRAEVPASLRETGAASCHTRLGVAG